MNSGSQQPHPERLTQNRVVVLFTNKSGGNLSDRISNRHIKPQWGMTHQSTQLSS